MQKRIEDLQSKEENLRASYDAKVISTIKKRKFTDRTTHEFTIMVAEKFGLEEQLFSLCNNQSVKQQKNFIDNLRELNYSNEEVEHLYAGNMEILPLKYKVVQEPDMIQKVFNKHHERFIKVLKEFIDKRNAYYKNENEKLLEEIVMLKANIIYHLCIMEKLVFKNKNNK
nr:pkip [Mamestra configurata nucleopolyhedrovirus A]